MASDALTDAVGLVRAHYVGAASEHLAAALFMRSGWPVYWPAVQQSWVDFVSFKAGAYVRVQVKTATWNRASPPFHYLQCRLRAGRDDVLPFEERFDELVVVYDADCWVIPAREIDTSNLCLMTTNPTGRASRWDPYRVPLFPPHTKTETH